MTQANQTRPYDFTGRSALVTGGTGILCAAIARALAVCNADVAILGRNREKGEAVVRELSSLGSGKSLAVYGDVLVRDDVHRAAEEAIRTFGKIDVLVNGAGGNNPRATTNPSTSFFDLPAEALEAVFDLNMLGTFIPSQVVGRHMAARKEGTILNVTSMAAERPLTRVVAYGAAKAGVSNFTRWMAVHMAQEYSPAIRVNAISPGFFLTEQNRFLLTDRETGKLTERGGKIIAHTPMGRFGNAEDLTGAALWLLSPAAAFVTGVVLPVDGGFSAYSGV
jgi:NAD(P)-dependent dehydrogenase (short-subunit alcohol dehydrogenase family)